MSYLSVNEDFKTSIHNIITGATLGYHTGNSKNVPAISLFQNFIASKLIRKPLINLAVSAISSGKLKDPFFAANLIHHIYLLPTLLQVGSALIGGKDAVDRAYFDHHWDISSMYPQIEKWCKEAGGLLVTDDNKVDMENYSMKKIGDTTHEIGNSRSFTAIPTKFKTNLTTALTCLPIKSGNGFYYVYPIFDTNDIIDIKVLCSKDKHGFEVYAKSLKPWKKIDHSQFKK